MKKARLIKKVDVVEIPKANTKRRRSAKPALSKTIDTVKQWIDSQRNDREDPRKAFANLFTQPQTQ